MREVVHITGERVRLVPLDEETHLENYVQWLNDPEVTRYLGRVTPLTQLEEREFFRTVAERGDHVIWAVHDEADRHIGGTGLHSINWQDRSAVSGTIIGDKQAWNMGYGTEVMKLRTRWAFEELGLHRIESECFDQNIASIKCLERSGYSRIGIARKKRWRNGDWHDCILWEILDEDYFGHAPNDKPGEGRE